MEFSTVILRFRDLVTEKDATIGRHKEIIKNNVWWGWWNKGNERDYMKKEICRINEGKMAEGVCGGIAKYFGIDVSIMRFI